MMEFVKRGGIVSAVAVAMMLLSGESQGITITTGDRPSGVTVDPSDGSAWIAISMENKVVHYSPQGAAIGTISTGSYPTSIAFDLFKNIWVTTVEDSSLSLYSQGGTLIRSFGVGGDPDTVVVDSLGNPWISDPEMGTISKYTPEGELIFRNSISFARDLTLDKRNNGWFRIIPTSRRMRDLQGSFVQGPIARMNPNGKIIAFGIGKETIQEAVGVAYDAKNDLIWVSDSSKKLYKISKTNAVTFVVQAIYPIGPLAIDGDRIWTFNGEKIWLQMFSTAGKQLRQFRIGAPSNKISAGAKNVWVTHSGMNYVSKVGPGSGPVE